VKKLAALGFLAALCTSCLPVPFDLGVSQSVATAAKMTRDNGSSITVNRNGSESSRNFTFYPQVLASGGFDYSAGFVAWQDDFSVGVQAVINGSQFSNGGQPIANPDAHAPPYLGWPVKSGTTYLFGIIFDAVNPASSGYALFQATPPSIFTANGSSLLSLVTPMGSVTAAIGASVMASPSAAFDRLHVLAVGATSWVEAAFQVQSSGVNSSTLLRAAGLTLSFLPTGIKRVMYFYDDNAAADPGRVDNRSFASWYDDSSSSWVSWAWWEQPVGTLHSMRLPADHRLDALLSTGQLLSTEDGVGRLYDRDGNLQATFPLGNLTYIAEEYVGGVPRCYFSQSLVYDHQLHFNIYWIATDQLSTLGK
jgi:hypothetical protein